MTLPSLEELRSSIRVLREGRREKTLFLLATSLVSAAALVDQLPKRIGSFLDPFYPDLVLGALAAFFYGWLIVRLWRQARPRSGPALIRPSAIKGPRSFGPQDGELFLRLGREAELGQLLDSVLDPQVGLVVLMGESGAGKTSLLRSGLHYQLEKKQEPAIPCIYWEALPSDPAASFLHTARQKVPEPNPLTVASLEDAPRVVVLDQLEQLNPEDPAHAALFDLVREAGERRAPFRNTWVVAFRREFAPVWDDFEIANPDLRCRRLSLKRFPPKRAKEILATLAETVDLVLDEALLDDLVSTAADKSGVSAVDLGIGMLVLYELARSKELTSLSRTDYRFAGGSEGLLAGYVLDRLSDLEEEGRQAVLKALLLLVDLANDQRIAEGRSLADLAAEAGRSPRRMESDLEALVEARILEQVAPTVYRLQHERLIAPLRLLTGKLLAEADRARFLLTEAYRRWLRYPRANALLKGSDLRFVLRYRGRLGALQPEAMGFVRQSQVRSRWRWAAAIGLSAVTLSGLAYSVHLRKIEGYSKLLQGAGLPPELASFQSQLRSLYLEAPLQDLSWLHAPLSELDFSARLMDELPPLPPTLVRLAIRDGNPGQLEHLQNFPQLEELAFEAPISKVPSLRRFPHLRKLTLTLMRTSPVDALAALSSLPALEELDLGLEVFQRVGEPRGDVDLPPLHHLRVLDATGIHVRTKFVLPRLEKLSTASPENFQGFAPQLTQLDIAPGPLCDPSKQPFLKLETLKLVQWDPLNPFPPLENTSCVPHLRDIRVSAYGQHDQGIKFLPPPLRGLITSYETFCDSHTREVLASLPRIKELLITDTEECTIGSFPRGLESLTLKNFSARPFDLPSGLRSLTLEEGSPELTPWFLRQTLPQLNSLTVLHWVGPLSSLEVFPALKDLSLRLEADNLQTVPALRKLETLSLSVGRDVSIDLKHLSPLPRLRSFRIEGGRLHHLDALPSTVTELYLLK